MKKLLTIGLIAFTMNVFGQISGFGGEIGKYYSSGEFTGSATEVSVTIVGTIMLKGDIWVIHGTSGNTSEVQDFYPRNLTKQFKEEGLRVSVNATLDTIPEGVRMAGAPITIVTIQKI